MTMRMDAAPAPGAKGLRRGALGMTSSVVIGLASTAPAYSLAASLGLIVVLAGDKTPAILLIAFVPMFLIAVAFRELNKGEPDCGTTFTWSARAFGPWAGWLGGWAIVAADVIVMANLAQIAGSYTFQLAGLTDLAESTLWTTAAGVVWITLMTWICHRGIEISARLQSVLLSVEVLVLAVFAVVALTKVWAGDGYGRAQAPNLGWLWPSGMGPGDIVNAVLIAVFLYWGWDTAVSVNEEADDPRRTPGRAGVMSTLLLVTTYVLVSVSAIAFAGTGTEGIGLGNPDNGSDIFAAVGPAVFGDNALGHVLEILLLVSVLTSSAASTQTTILPAARVALSMGAYRAVPRRFALVNTGTMTPGFATWGMGITSIVFYVGLTTISTSVLTDSIAAVALLIAFYYGMTGFACVWTFRRSLQGRALWTRGVLPGLGGLMLLGAFVMSAVGYAAPDGGETNVFGVGGVFVIGIGALLLGAVLMFGYSRIAPAFFRGDTLLPPPDPATLPPMPWYPTTRYSSEPPAPRRLPASGYPASGYPAPGSPATGSPAPGSPAPGSPATAEPVTGIIPRIGAPAPRRAADPLPRRVPRHRAAGRQHPTEEPVVEGIPAPRGDLFDPTP